MDNQFKVGTIFIGNMNKVKMQVLKISYEATRGRLNNYKTVKYRNLKNGKCFECNLKTLEMCDLTVLVY